MANRTKLLNLLKVLNPDKTSVDFAELDAQVAKLKDALKEKVQAQTLEDVSIQLEKFKKKLDFKSLFEAMATLESTLDQKIKGISGLLSAELSTLKKLSVSHEESAKEKISSVASNIEVLKQELHFLNDQKSVELLDLKEKLSKFQGFLSELKKEVEESRFDDKPLKKEVKELTEALEKLRKELNNRLSNLGGGAMNRQNFIGNVDPLTKYTDINWKAGSNVTITYANNNTTKRVDITISSSGGGGGTTRSINSISVDTAAGNTSGTDYVYLVIGTTTLTLPTAVGNSNLYTIKNVGTGIVTVATTGGETIDGATTQVMPVQFTSIDVISDTANWNIT